MLILPSAADAIQSNNHLSSKHGVTAYTWNSNPSAKNANLGKSRYTFNAGRPVTRNRTSVGVYQVKFEGLNCEGGQFTVNAYGGSEYKSCRIGSWNGEQNCEVSVYCFDAKGNHYDSQFNLIFID
jgi:hypothetical protein